MGVQRRQLSSAQGLALFMWGDRRQRPRQHTHTHTSKKGVCTHICVSQCFSKHTHTIIIIIEHYSQLPTVCSHRNVMSSMYYLQVMSYLQYFTHSTSVFIGVVAFVWYLNRSYTLKGQSYIYGNTLVLQ